MNFTRKQVVFLITYPFVHLILSLVLGQLMHFSEGILPSIGIVSLQFSLAPLILWERLGLPVSQQIYSELSIFFCGVLYALIGVLVYKFIARR